MHRLQDESIGGAYIAEDAAYIQARLNELFGEDTDNEGDFMPFNAGEIPGSRIHPDDHRITSGCHWTGWAQSCQGTDKDASFLDKWDKAMDAADQFNDDALKAGRKLCNPPQGDDVVITGIAGKFPDSDDVYHLRDNLFNKVDLVSGDYRRWKPFHPEVVQRTGKINGVEKFDAGFFGISELQANYMDPMVRLVLERTFEAIVDAGYHPSELVGTNTGVFISSSFSETESHSFYNSQVPNSDCITGVARSMLANRLSYYYQLKGPSYISDTACSSVMFGFEQAYRAIRNGTCDRAIVGATSLCLLPNVSLQFSRLGVLSPDGVSRSFDHDANGYARSEGICVILLEKSKDARRIYSHVVHAKTNSDGFKEQGLTFPSSEVQTLLLKEFYEECQIDPATLTFLEAHGTGTRAGDPVEVKTIDRVFCAGRDAPLYIGSVKSNIGHNEPVAALCSIIKVVIGMEAGFIPPNIHFKKSKEGVEAMENGRIKVVTEKMAWSDDVALVGVNCFGFGGSNGHTLLRMFKKVKTKNGSPEDNLPRLVCVSGRTLEGVESILDDVRGRQLDVEYIKLLHTVFGKRIKGHMHRGFSIVGNYGEIKRSLSSTTPITRRVCLMFTTFDKNWLKIGNQLLSVPIFFQTIQKIQDVLAQESKVSVSKIFEKSTVDSALDQILGTVAVQVGLVDMLKALGAVPDFLRGIGTGNLLAAYFEEYLTLTEVVLASMQVGLAVVNGKNNLSDQVNNLKKIVPKKQFQFKKWLPCGGHEHNAQGSAEYFMESVVSPTSFQKATTSVPNDSLVVIIGPPDPTDKTDHLHLIQPDFKDDVLSLLTSLGCLYNYGCDMQFDKLYPNVEWPVSRGTPMISPLIKWRHDSDYYVASYTEEAESKVLHRLVKVDPKLDEWSFACGHVVDGRNLFPATGYLFIAWEAYSYLTGKLMHSITICFEDVKFIRASHIPSKGALELVVSIQYDANKFEITEGGVAVVCGKIYECGGDAFAVLPEFTGRLNDLAMGERDIYKELSLRGYNYTGQFRSLKSCDFDVTKARLHWAGNWISFMDCMLQLQVLHMDTRNVYVPTSIQRVLIDGPRHLKFVERHTEDNILPLYHYKDPKVIRSGGIEIMGTVANSIPRKKMSPPVLESYRFMPNEGAFALDDSVRIMMQVILENSNVIKVKTVEIDCAKSFLSPIIANTLGDVPLIQPEIVVLSARDLDLPGVAVEDKKMATQNNVVLIIDGDIFGGGKDLKEMLNVIKENNGYIMSREKANFDTSLVDSKDLEILCVHKNQSETLILMQASIKKERPTVVDVTHSEDLNWLPRLQDAVKSAPNVVVYAHGRLDNGILGLVNCLRREPNGGKISCLYVTGDVPHFDPNDEFYAKQLRKGFAFNIWKDSKWGTYRHLLLDELENVDSEHCFVNAAVRGDLSSLRWSESSLNATTVVASEKTLVHAYYSAVNFRDVMIATGRIGVDVFTMDRIAQEYMQGLEFSGRDSTGRRVMGMVNNGAISTLVAADSHLLWPIPDDWSMEDAASVPVVYGTVLYALLLRAHLKRGQSILIHSGTGGVGQAAINVALHYNCTVFTTVGTQEKRDFIKRQFPQIKDDHIGNSRDTSFEQMVYHQTKSRGVDVVLNSLAEEKLQASVRCLAPGGRFLEIGKFDLSSDNALRTHTFSEQITFEGIMLDRLFEGSSGVKRKLAACLTEGIRNGSVKPLPRTVFKDDELEQAYRFMATGKHMGKVLIRIRGEEAEKVSLSKREFFKGVPRFYCHPEETCVILGGLGGFGMELADWLVLRGARNLLLTSRGGVKNGYQTSRLGLWKTCGVKILLRTDDASTLQSCAAIIDAANSLGPVGAIFNLAVALKDALFENQNPDDFKTSLMPKGIATRNLDVISRKMCPRLRHFVVFSSASCGRGNAGQTNYGMGNSIMERICEQRKADGYPALAIQWGVVGDVGLLADMQDNHKELVIGGTLPQKISSCLQVLDKFLRQEKPIVSSMVVAEKRASSSGAHNIIEAVSNIIGISDIKTISLHATFPELGMDSMMAVEIKQTLEREYEVFLTAQDIRTMTVAKLQSLASDKVQGKAAETESAEVVSKNIKLLLRYIGNEAVANVPVLNLKGSDDRDRGGPTVYMLPGLEGVGVILETVARNLRGDAVCLQFCSQNNADSIESLAKSIYPHMESIQSEFTLVAYSYGCMIATELVHLLEESGRRGKVVFIDGSCDLMQQLVRNHLQIDSDELFQTSILCALMNRYMPVDEILKHRLDILKCKTIEERIQYVLSVSPKVEFSNDYLTDMYRVGYLRTNAILKYAPSYDKLKSTVKLFKPTQPTVADFVEDYALSKWFENVAGVEVFDGDHATLLENPRVPEEINKFFASDHQ